MINIASLSFNFDQTEDRIRLIGNLSNGQVRVDYWLTRRLVLRLLHAAPDMMEKASAHLSQVPAQHRSAMVQFEHDKVQHSSASVQREETTLASEVGAVILRRIDISVREGRFQLGLFAEETDTPQAVCVLSHEEMHQILFWLHKGAVELEWGVPDQLFAEAAPTGTLQ